MDPFPAHFDGKRFFNPGAPQARGFRDVLRWKFTSRPERRRSTPDCGAATVPAAGLATGGLRVTFVNHSTVLLQHGGAAVLTDPIWSEHAGPFGSIGPRRRCPPGIRLDDLPPIDIVLLSHNHYDHLDLPTLARLARRGPSQFVVPLGVGRLLRSQKINPVHELDWGECATLAGIAISAVPALHFSGRGIFDRNRALWCGYVLETAQDTTYFAGDTGFGNHFAAIRSRFGAPRLALLPIGAYEPRWFMAPVHMSPEEAIEAHRVLDAATTIAIHHGTFQLADEAIGTPQRVLRECGAPESFLVLANGQSVEVPSIARNR